MFLVTCHSVPLRAVWRAELRLAGRACIFPVKEGTRGCCGHWELGAGVGLGCAGGIGGWGALECGEAREPGSCLGGKKASGKGGGWGLGQASDMGACWGPGSWIQAPGMWPLWALVSGSSRLHGPCLSLFVV